MRYYLDTNILVAFARGVEKDKLARDVYNMIMDDTALLYTSTVCVQELLHLIQIGKIRLSKKYSDRDASLALQLLEQKGIQILPVTESHHTCYAELPMLGGHHDPNDRLIIAQAIDDKITLVSSDLKFIWYERFGLKLLRNDF